MKQRTPTRRKFRDSDDAKRTEQRLGKADAGRSLLNDVDRSLRRRRQPFEHRRLKPGDGSDAGILGRLVLEYKTGPPSLTQGSGGGGDEARQVLYRVEFSKSVIGRDR